MQMPSLQSTNTFEKQASDMVSRFTVLRFLWTAWIAQRASGQSEDEEDVADKATRVEAHKDLLEFVDRLAPESIATPEQAMWEFKQAFILFHWERLKRLGGRYQTLAGLSNDDLNLLLGRALWLSNSWHWAKVILSSVSGHQTEDLAWEPFIDGDQLLVSSLAGLPPESHGAALSKDLVLESIACLRKVQPESMGPHWGILADCEAMTGMPGQCAEIWEKHGIEILKPVAHANGRSPADILSLPDYQFPIANLWKEAERTNKVIKTLELLRGRYPGVNRTLVDCYLRIGDLETATLRAQDEAKDDEVFREDSIVRLLLRQCGKAEEAERHLKRKRKRNTRVVPTVPGRGQQSGSAPHDLEALRSVVADVQSRWVMALHWCYGEHPAAFSDTEWAGRAIGDCTVAFEIHLQETLFEPLRRAVTETEIDSLPGIHP